MIDIFKVDTIARPKVFQNTQYWWIFICSHMRTRTHTHHVHGAKDDNDKNLTKDYTQDDDDTKNSKKQWECENGFAPKNTNL